MTWKMHWWERGLGLGGRRGAVKRLYNAAAAAASGKVHVNQITQVPMFT